MLDWTEGWFFPISPLFAPANITKIFFTFGSKTDLTVFWTSALAKLNQLVNIFRPHLKSYLKLKSNQILFCVLENEKESLPCALFSAEIQHYLQLQEFVYSILAPKMQGWLKHRYWLFTVETSTSFAKVSVRVRTVGEHFANDVSLEQGV